MESSWVPPKTCGLRCEFSALRHFEKKNMNRRDFIKLIGCIGIGTQIKLPMSIPSPIAIPAIIPAPTSLVAFTEPDRKIVNALADAYALMECHDLSVERVILNKTTFEAIKAGSNEKMIDYYRWYFKAPEPRAYIWGASYQYNSDMRDNVLYLESESLAHKFSFAVELGVCKSKMLSESSYCTDVDFKKAFERPPQHEWTELDIKDIARDCKKFDMSCVRFLDNVSEGIVAESGVDLSKYKS